MNISANNLVYWLTHPLDKDEQRALRLIQQGYIPDAAGPTFAVAYLISLGCVEMDDDAGTLSVTEKGEEAMEFFSKDPPP